MVTPVCVVWAGRFSPDTARRACSHLVFEYITVGGARAAVGSHHMGRLGQLKLAMPSVSSFGFIKIRQEQEKRRTQKKRKEKKNRRTKCLSYVGPEDLLANTADEEKELLKPRCGLIKIIALLSKEKRKKYMVEINST